MQESDFKKKKTVMEIILVAMTDSSDVNSFDLYLINIFTKSTKAERCTDVMFKATLYCLMLILFNINIDIVLYLILIDTLILVIFFKNLFKQILETACEI